MDITREQCREHYAASHMLYEVNPDPLYERYHHPHRVMSDAAFDAGKVEVASYKALSVGALCERVAALGYDGMYDVRGRLTQYACQCARQGDLEAAHDALMMCHKMDKMRAAIAPGFENVDAVRLLVPLISALSGGEAGRRFVCRYRQWLVLTPDGKECLALNKILPSGEAQECDCEIYGGPLFE
jgi:hypothetical protein